MKKSSIILSFIVAAEIVAIALIRTRLLQKRAQLGSAVAVIPISKENISTSTASALKYFYEPQPNRTQTTQKNWLPKTTYQTVNADSLYERYNYTIEKPADTFRIITLGDSFTMGWGVNTPDNYPEVLEDMLNRRLYCSNFNKFEVINLGVGGYDIEYSVERFRIRGAKYQPDLVLWFLNSSDFSSASINEIYIPRVRYYEAQLQAFGQEYYQNDQNDYYPAATLAGKELKEKFRREDIDRYTSLALRRINDYYKGPLVIFTMQDALDRGAIKIIENFSLSRPVTYFYDGIVNVQKDPALRLPDTHPNEVGHRRIAEELFDYLMSSGLIPCSPNE